MVENGCQKQNVAAGETSQLASGRATFPSNAGVIRIATRLGNDSSRAELSASAAQHGPGAGT
jgi:hypothetical protein